MAYNKSEFYHESGKQVIDNIVLENVSTQTSPILGTVFKAIAVSCINNYTLTNNEQDATYISINVAEASKTLTLNMQAGQRITITNFSEENVTVKNNSICVGAVSTAEKTAEFIVTSDKIIKLTSDVESGSYNGNNGNGEVEGQIILGENPISKVYFNIYRDDLDTVIADLTKDITDVEESGMKALDLRIDDADGKTQIISFIDFTEGLSDLNYGDIYVIGGNVADEADAQIYYSNIAIPEIEVTKGWQDNVLIDKVTGELKVSNSEYSGGIGASIVGVKSFSSTDNGTTKEVTYDNWGGQEEFDNLFRQVPFEE